jgi:hypothetical protein
MIPNLAEIIIVAATPALILLMFLPAFVELKKPKDCGPRMIPLENSAINIFMTRFVSIANMEDEEKFDGLLIQTMAKIVGVLPSLES